MIEAVDIFTDSAMPVRPLARLFRVVCQCHHEWDDCAVYEPCGRCNRQQATCPLCCNPRAQLRIIGTVYGDTFRPYPQPLYLLATPQAPRGD